MLRPANGAIGRGEIFDALVNANRAIRQYDPPMNAQLRRLQYRLHRDLAVARGDGEPGSLHLPVHREPSGRFMGEGPPKMSRHRLWPMIPASSDASAPPPYSGWRAGSYSDGSIDGHGGIHSGLIPVGLSRISAM